MQDIAYRQKVRDLNNRAKQQGATGKLNENDLLAVYEFYGGHCLVPGCTNTDYQFDHVIPLEKQGLNARRNLQLLCESHNKSKRAKDYRNGRICPDDYKPTIEKPETKAETKRGGYRSNSGRKPLEITIAKRRLRAERVDDAQYMLDMLTTWAKTDELDVAFRRDCANDVLDRILGKPNIMNPSENDDLQKQYLENVRSVVFGTTQAESGNANAPESGQPDFNAVYAAIRSSTGSPSAN